MAVKWQAVHLAPPPNRCLVTDGRDVLSLKKVCSSFLKVLLNQKPLHMEAALLSRMIYRMKTKFRHDKGFKLMEKVNRCLLQYLRVNLASVYGNFTSCIKASFDEENPLELSHKVYAPSRQMLEFLILRTLGFIKVLCKAVQYCEEAAIYLQNRIYIGHSWNYALVAISMIARIWCLSKYLVLSACEHHKNIVPFLDKLNYIGHLWNGLDTKYPVDIDSWLNVWWITGKSQLKLKGEAPDVKTTCLDKVIQDNSGKSLSMEMSSKETLNQFNRVKTDADLGEPVERSSMKNQLRSNRTRALDAGSKHCSVVNEKSNPLKKVKCAEDLLKFLECEEKKRSKRSDSAFTKNMDKFQFNLFAKKIHEFVKKLSGLDHQEDSNEFKLALRKCKKVLRLYVQ